jgi:hypothetical protein
MIRDISEEVGRIFNNFNIRPNFRCCGAIKMTMMMMIIMINIDFLIQSLSRQSACSGFITALYGLSTCVTEYI